MQVINVANENRVLEGKPHTSICLSLITYPKPTSDLFYYFQVYEMKGPINRKNKWVIKISTHG